MVNNGLWGFHSHGLPLNIAGGFRTGYFRQRSKWIFWLGVPPFFLTPYNVVPPKIAFSWFISTITFGVMEVISILTRVYKPTNITGGGYHLVVLNLIQKWWVHKPWRSNHSDLSEPSDALRFSVVVKNLRCSAHPNWNKTGECGYNNDRHPFRNGHIITYNNI